MPDHVDTFINQEREMKKELFTLVAVLLLTVYGTVNAQEKADENKSKREKYYEYFAG